MASDNLYDDLIMDHIKNARNFRALDDANHQASGSNPLCGDEVTIGLKISDDNVEDIAFQCTCCGISMASASIMTESMRGMSVTDARTELREFVAMLRNHVDSPLKQTDDARRAILATVADFPARTRCAVLPWLTLEAALDNRRETVLIR